MKNLFFVFLYCGLLGLNTTNIGVVEQQNTSNFFTQRIWFCITSNNFLKEDSELRFETVNEFSGESKINLIQKAFNYTGFIYYFVDIPLDSVGFRIASIDNDGVCATKWNYNIVPTKLYEVWGDSTVLRKRNADVSPPDATIISLFLSAYLSLDDSYENGYSAFGDIKSSWLNYYAGNVKGTLENTFFLDYSDEDYLNKDNAVKNVIKSASSKINELETNYLRYPHKQSKTANTNRIIGVIFLVISTIIAAGLFFVIRGKFKK